MYGQNNDGDHIREFEKFENKTIKILGFLSVHCYQLVNNKECIYLILEFSFFLSPILEHQLFKKAPKDNSCHTVVKTTTINTVTYCSTCSSGPESTGYGEE